VVERQLPKLHVVGSIPIARSRRLRVHSGPPDVAFACNGLIKANIRKVRLDEINTVPDEMGAGKIASRAVIDLIQNQDVLGGNGAEK
jgi:D-arabinose 1-dehydrogenase-like Zn-dependent alcohol dehydrogenase